MAINVGKMVVGDKTVVEASPSPTKDITKSKDDIRRKALKRMNTDERLKDPRHLKIHEIDNTPTDKKVSQYMLDMYDSNGLISFDK
jgi:hypothetical protein